MEGSLVDAMAKQHSGGALHPEEQCVVEVIRRRSAVLRAA
jgi:hypothetical protein